MLFATLALAGAGFLCVPALPPQLNSRFAAQQLAYESGSSGVATSMLVVGDLNGDGRADVVVPTWNGPVHVFLANAHGALRGPFVSDLGDAGTSLWLGDIDEDGRDDLALHVGGQPVWAASDGAGGFGPVQAIAPAPGGIDELVDIDLDGHLDVLSVSTGAVQVLLGNGAGQFTPLAPVPIVGAGSPRTGDLDGDGLPDVVLMTPGSTYTTMLQLGGGVLVEAASVATPVYASSELELGDLDQDGDLDLVAAGKADFAVFLGNGDGTFQPGVLTREAGVSSIELCDWDADGRLDLVVGDFTGGYGPSILRWAAGDGLGGFGSMTALPSGTHSDVRAAADVNGDGRLDLVAGQISGFYGIQSGSTDVFEKVCVLLGDGAGGVRGRPQSAELPVGVGPFVGSSYHWKVRGDVNGDGIVDLVRVDANQPLAQIRLGNGAGAYGAPTDVALPFQANSIHLGDVDGDGLEDLVCANTFGSLQPVVTLKGDGLGNFSGPVAGSVAGSGPVELVDFDGDGRADLAGCGAGQFFLALGQPNGSFSAQTPIGGFTATGFVERFADLDGDGHLDVMTGPVSSQFGAPTEFRFGFGDGAGGLTSISNLTVFHTASTAVLGDLDGDGDPDLAFGRVSDISGSYYDVGVLRNNGSGQFGTPRMIDVGAHPHVLEVADLDNDGRGDLIAWTEAGSLVWLSFGKPQHTLAQDFVVNRRHFGLGWDTPIGVGHANLDGRLDIVVTRGVKPATYLNLGP